LLFQTDSLVFKLQGRQFGADGNLAEWWEPKTKEAFLEKAQCIIDQYGNYSFPELELNVCHHVTLLLFVSFLICIS